jgi:hypothetical protein
VTVTKVVNNEFGGEAKPDDFLLTLDGKAVLSGAKTFVLPGTYVIAETLVSGYEFDGIKGDCYLDGEVIKIDVALGESVSCTLTNSDTPSYVTVTKVVNNEFGGEAKPDDFLLTLDGKAVLSGAKTFVLPGTYVIAETLVSGYEFDGIKGDCYLDGEVIKIDVALGESVSCTLTNSDTPSYVTVTKVVNNDFGGEAKPDDFLLTLDGKAVLSGAKTFVLPGTYVIAETLVSGYEFDGIKGDCYLDGEVIKIDVALGESVSCTLTNSDTPSYVTVTKVVNNEFGGEAKPDDFLLTLDGKAVLSGAKTFVLPGTYVIAETLVSGYEFDGIKGDCYLDGEVIKIDVALGESVSCTLTNSDTPSYVTVTKVVNNEFGGEAKPDDFLLTLDGKAVLSGAKTFVLPGTYVIAETLVSGYEFDGIKGDCYLDGEVIKIDVALGESVSCTLTNSDTPSYVTVTKVVNNEFGGEAKPDDFLLTLDGKAVLSGVKTFVLPGTYVIAETLVSGYEFDGIKGDCYLDGEVIKIDVALGESVSCTLTNSDTPSYVTVTKVVNNEFGGEAKPDDFLLTLDGKAVLSGAKTFVLPGTYVIAETLVSGYEFDGIKGDCYLDGEVIKIDVALGESVSCTLTNSDTPSYVTVTKVVNNEFGGEAKPDDFLLTLDGKAVLSGVKTFVLPGTYVIAETLVSGYEFDGIKGDCYLDGEVIKIDVALGESVSCTLTNSDTPSYVTVTKVVNNEFGGEAKPDDFLLTLDGKAVLSGAKTFVLPGTYVIAETLVSGYEFDGIKGDCYLDGEVIKIDVALGESVSCTLTNSDTPSYVTVTKVVNNEFGGEAKPDDFLLTLDGKAVLSGAKTFVLPGTYVIAETLVSGYEFDGIKGDCYLDGEVIKIDVALGESVSCTLTNSDTPSYVTVTKVVNNEFGGEAKPDDFLLTLDGKAVLSGAKTFVLPGTYVIAETLVSGYEFDGIKGDCYLDGEVIKIDVALGESVSCTLTNSDIQPQLIVIKIVDNLGYGTALPEDFTMLVDGTNVDPASFPGEGAPGTTVTLNAGMYEVTETADPALLALYAASYSADCSGTIAVGETKTCTVTNTLQIAGWTPASGAITGTRLNPTVRNAWQYTDYNTDDLLGDIFDLGELAELRPRGSNMEFGDYTLLEALSFRGGGGISGAGEILMRAAVASLLNASFAENYGDDIDGLFFPLTVQDVLDKVAGVLDPADRSKMLDLAYELDVINNGGWAEFPFSYFE